MSAPLPDLVAVNSPEGFAAYVMPEIPAGVSPDLSVLIARYFEQFRDPDDKSDESQSWDNAYKDIIAFTARSLDDVAAKLIISKHWGYPSDSTSAPMLLDNFNTDDCRHMFASLLQDLAALRQPQVPEDLATLHSHYAAARQCELTYDEEVWLPAYRAHEAGGPPIPDEVDAEMERLQDLRDIAETSLMNYPSPDPAFTLFKYLIATGDGREAFSWASALAEPEAKKFAAAFYMPIPEGARS